MKRTVILLIGLIAFCSAATGPALSAATADRNMLRLVNYELIGLKKFFVVGATTAGTTKEIGLDDEDLNELVRLRFKNVFTGMPVEKLPEDVRGMVAPNADYKEWGSLLVHVWTVGNDRPVAYHVELVIKRFGGGGGEYRDAMLGYSSADGLRDRRVIKDVISDLMDRAAATFFKVRGEL